MLIRPTRPKGPHLNALRAFEVAARLGSFTAAATELCVTPGAVTQHIKSLESWAEAKLFIRKAKGVELTPLAEELLPEFIRAFDHLGVAVQALRNKATPLKIKVAALPSIAQLWLAPRLGRLRKSAPEISVSVVAMETPPNALREVFDITLFYSTDPLGPNEICVAVDEIFPVCSPELASRLNRLADLSHETLLYDSVWGDDWDLWLKQQPDAADLSRKGILHSLFSVALEEARNDGGVLIAHKALVELQLRSGDLVRPFASTVELPQKLIASVTPSCRRSAVFAQISEVLFDSII